MFSLDPNSAFATFAKQGADGRSRGKTPEQIDQLILARKRTNEPRPFVVVVDGDQLFCEWFRDGVKLADVMIFCTNEQALRSMRVEQLDRGWNKSEPPIDINKILLDPSNAARRSSGHPQGRSGDRPSRGQVAGDIAAGLVGFALGKASESKNDEPKRTRHLCGNCVRGDAVWVISLERGSEWLVCNECADQWRAEGRVRKESRIEDDTRYG